MGARTSAAPQRGAAFAGRSGANGRISHI